MELELGAVGLSEPRAPKFCLSQIMLYLCQGLFPLPCGCAGQCCGNCTVKEDSKATVVFKVPFEKFVSGTLLGALEAALAVGSQEQNQARICFQTLFFKLGIVLFWF